MKVRTFSVVSGTTACNARCPFCVAKMTPTQGDIDPNSINKRNLDIACRLADKAGVTTALITGKGEPTLYPEMISSYLSHLSSYFPLIELQTNGLILATPSSDTYLRLWYKLGLTTISLSVVHYDDARNGEIYTNGKGYFDLKKLINKLHAFGFSVRLGVIAIKKYISTPKKVIECINFARDNNVEQLTIRPMTAGASGDNKEVIEWIKHKSVEKYWDIIVTTTLRQVRNHLLSNLIHGGKVYDVDGQNVCFYNCLTIDPDVEELRQLIFFPNGRITHDWNFKGARIL